MKKLMIPIVILAFLYSCDNPSNQETDATEDMTVDTTEEDMAAISKAGEALIEALENDNLSGILDGLAEDHITMAPNEPLLANEATLRSWHQSRIDAYTFNSTFSTEDIKIKGDIAVERWSSNYTLTARTGDEVIEGEFKGLWMWMRQADGSWKLTWSIWNSDLPVDGN